MGNIFYNTGGLTREDILNDFFDVDNNMIEISEPLDLEDITTDNRINQCRICNKNVALFTVIPCNHRCICNNCLKVIYEKREEIACPYPDCSKKIQKII
jgi:hypothetical protein